MQFHTSNRLLETLGEGDCASIWRESTPVTLALGETLWEPGDRVPYAYFPTGAVVSLITVLASGEQNEAGIIGRNGIVGALAAIGDEWVAPWRAVVQIEGEALQIDISTLKRCMRETQRVDRLIQRAGAATVRMTSQMAACARFHGVRARCARWMLRFADEADTLVFPMTQELLAMTMGIDRANLSGAAASLQNAGLIRYRRGVIEVLDRAGLEAQSCECYGFTRGQYDWIAQP